MKTTYTITLGFILLLFVGCGGGSSKPIPEAETQAVPKSPVHNDQTKSPPSIPNI